MYLRLAFWTLAMSYVAFLFARFVPTSGPSSLGVVFTSTIFGALVGLALAGMFVKRTKRKRALR